MKVVALVVSVLGLSGCAARTIAALVPKLDLQLSLRRRELAAEASGSGQTEVVLGAQLRWFPSWDAPDTEGTMPLQEELVSCDVGEASCLAALYAVDPELVGSLEVP